MKTNEQNDRELLELAAKAAGLLNPQYEQAVAGNWNIYHGDADDPRECWNPLTDDGDALRLAVKLGLQCDFGNSMVTHPVEVGGNGTNPNVASRQAIVRAAAEIGKAMP